VGGNERKRECRECFLQHLWVLTHVYATSCDKCQCIGNISRRHEMPLQAILEVEVFDC